VSVTTAWMHRWACPLSAAARQAECRRCHWYQSLHLLLATLHEPKNDMRRAAQGLQHLATARSHPRVATCSTLQRQRWLQEGTERAIFQFP
jgi:hypothetical protein